jgi:hypothetical protein
MAAIETYAGRGELYCDHCDLTIGGNEAKTPDELVALLEQGTCHMEVCDNLDESEGMGDVWLECDKCHWQMMLEPTTPRFKHCPNCGKRLIKED